MLAFSAKIRVFFKFFFQKINIFKPNSMRNVGRKCIESVLDIFSSMFTTLDIEIQDGGSQNGGWKTQKFWIFPFCLYVMIFLMYWLNNTIKRVCRVAKSTVRIEKFKMADPRWRTMKQNNTYFNRNKYQWIIGNAEYKSVVRFRNYTWEDSIWRIQYGGFKMAGIT